MISRVGQLAFRVACSGDVSSIVRITNQAFMADAFFKKPQYIERFTDEAVNQMMLEPNGAFLVACSQEGSVVGSIYLSWEGERIDETGAKVRFCAVELFTLYNCCEVQGQIFSGFSLK
jgi:hypothetical protein